MITEEMYCKFIIKQQKVLTDEIKEAIKEQTRLSEIAHERQDIRDDLEEKSKNLIVSGFAKLKEKYPDIESKLGQKETTVEALRWSLNEYINKSKNYLYVSERMKEIPEFQENLNLQDELGSAQFVRRSGSKKQNTFLYQIDGYNAVYKKYVDRNIKILYSPRYDEVMIPEQ